MEYIRFTVINPSPRAISGRKNVKMICITPEESEEILNALKAKGYSELYRECEYGEEFICLAKDDKRVTVVIDHYFYIYE